MSFAAIAGHPRRHGIDTALDHLPGTIPNGSAVTVQAPGAIAGVAIAAAATPGALPIRDGAGRMKATAGAAADDTVVVSQLAGLGGADPDYWREPILYSLQNQNETDPHGQGIFPAQLLWLFTIPAAGNTINIRCGFPLATTYTGVWNVDIAIGVTIGQCIANLMAWVAGGARATHFTGNRGIMRLIDTVEQSIILIAHSYGGVPAIWGNAGMAAKLSILDITRAGKIYASQLAHLVALPVAEPGGTNFGFERTAAQLKIGESHFRRWDYNMITWRDFGSTSWVIS